jgi:hypothetical protein
MGMGTFGERVGCIRDGNISVLAGHGDAGHTRRMNNVEHDANHNRDQVNVPKTRRTYCKGKDCKKHTQHKVTQYKAGKVR